MGTKFYLPSSGTAPASPAFNAGWTDTSQSTRYPCDTSKASTAITTTNISNASTARAGVPGGPWVSKPLNAGQSISAQTVSIQARCSETAANNNLFMTWGVYVWNATGSTLQATLVAKRN